MKRSFEIHSENYTHAMVTISSLVREVLMAKPKAFITLTDEEKRRNIQNEKFHAICGDLAKAKPKWGGRSVDTEGWKRLLVDAWARATGRTQGYVVPSLDGESVVTLGIQTRTMPVKDMAELIEFAICYCVENEVELRE